jgi:hypothetical protein
LYGFIAFALVFASAAAVHHHTWPAPPPYLEAMVFCSCIPIALLAWNARGARSGFYAAAGAAFQMASILAIFSLVHKGVI